MGKADNMIKLMTDAYKKSEDSNNYKLFKMIENEINELSETQLKARQYKCIDLSMGKTLDLIGSNFGIERKGLSDDVYRVLLKAKVLRNLGTGAFDNVTELIAYALNTDISNILLSEDYSTGGRNGFVSINNLPLETLNNIGMSIEEYEKMLKDILPIGLGLSVTNVEGTFSFALGSADGEVDQIDNDTGFANDNQTIGGTLGASFGNVQRYYIIEAPVEGTITFESLTFGDITFGTNGLSVLGNNILIEKEVVEEFGGAFVFIFYIESGDETFKYIAAKGGWNYFDYAQEITITAPANAGTLTLEEHNNYITLSTLQRKISISHGATKYDETEGVVELTTFNFYETANGVTTNYTATLGEDNAWRYEIDA